MKPRDLEQEIQDAFDGELDDLRAVALKEALRKDPQALELYCDHAILDAELRRRAANRCKVPGSITARSEVAAARQRRRQATISLLSAAAVMLITAIVLHLILTPQQPLAELEVSPDSQLLTTDGATFESSSLERDVPLRLGQGVARLTFDSGVEAVIEGPATFKLLADHLLEIESGHSWFRVPPEARGFKVVAPQLEVVDLGTEFGVDLREDLRPQVHVLEGKVEIMARIGDAAKRELSAGQAATLSPDGSWSLGKAESHKFRKKLPPSLPTLKMDFERIDDAALVIEGDMIGAGEASARIVGLEHARLVPGIQGLALELDGKGAWIETTWPGIAGSAPRTLSLWCRVPEGADFQTAPPLAWWGNPALGVNRKFKVALHTRNDDRTTLRGSFGETFFDGDTDLADGIWHHLAVVYGGTRPNGTPDLRFYVDGRPEPMRLAGQSTAGIDTDVQSEGSGTMEIGKYELRAGDRNPFLRATLDEFRIFAGALEEDEIRGLSSAR